MSNEIATVNEESKVSEKLLGDYLKTLTDKLDDNQRMQFCAVAQAFNLNPFKREIYATTYRDKNTGKTNMSIVVGYEVYLKRAEMNPNFDGFETDFGTDRDRGIYCTCTVYRKDRNHATRSTVYLSEYSTGRSLWASKPTVMLEKVAICTAFRRSFPCDFGGIPYAPEELSQSTEEMLKKQGMTEVKAEQVQPSEEQPKGPTASQKFAKELQDMKAENPEAFEMVKESMTAHGWKKPSDIPPEEYDGIRKAFIIAKMPGPKEEAKDNNEKEANNG